MAYHFYLLDNIAQNGNSANWTYTFNPAGEVLTDNIVTFGPNGVPDPNESVIVEINGISYSTHYDGFADMGGQTISFDVITLTALNGDQLQYGISTNDLGAPNISTSVGSALDPFHYTTFCFVTETLITTSGSDVAVKNLKIGDTVITHNNGPQTISWVGKPCFPKAFQPKAFIRVIWR